ncbi:MAG TPA: hypothetical protein OIL99_13145 [Clostridiales bacterium]|nr:hypothetical protein [Clostridiales bacterium]
MTEKERFQRAFAPLHASPDTMTEVMKMTERKTKRPALRRTATIGLAAALVLALGSVAYARTSAAFSVRCSSGSTVR